MNNKENKLITLLHKLLEHGSPESSISFPFYSLFTKVEGAGLSAAVFLSYLFFRSRYFPSSNKNKGGWLTLRSDYIRAKTGLTWRQQQRCREFWCGKNIIQERKDPATGILQFRICFFDFAREFFNLPEEISPKTKKKEIIKWLFAKLDEPSAEIKNEILKPKYRGKEL